MSALEWGWLAMAGVGIFAGVYCFEVWCNSRVSIEQEKTRQAEVAAKAAKVKP